MRKKAAKRAIQKQERGSQRQTRKEGNAHTDFLTAFGQQFEFYSIELSIFFSNIIEIPDFEDRMKKEKYQEVCEGSSILFSILVIGNTTMEQVTVSYN